MIVVDGIEVCGIEVCGIEVCGAVCRSMSEIGRVDWQANTPT
jgi:hypothetical protein